MKWIMFRNKGLIPIKALHLMGASVKRTETPLGWYGTGAKHSFCSMLRLGINFHVFQGMMEINFLTAYDEQMKANQVFLEYDEGNGVKVIPTSLTTDLGKDWKTWFIFREIYANMIDEGFTEVIETSIIEPIEGYTSIYVEYAPFADVAVNFSQYFNFRMEPEFILETENRLPTKFFRNTVDQENSIFYRRGIRVHHYDVPSMFLIDIPYVTINEARTADNWDCFNAYGNSIYEMMKDRKFRDMMLFEKKETIGELFERDVWLSRLRKTYRTGESYAAAYVHSISKSIVASWDFNDLFQEYYFVDESSYGAMLVFDKSWIHDLDRPLIIVNDVLFAAIKSMPGFVPFVRFNDDWVEVDSPQFLNEMANLCLDIKEAFKFNVMPKKIVIAKFKSKVSFQSNYNSKSIAFNQLMASDGYPKSVVALKAMINLQVDTEETPADEWFLEYLLKKANI